VTLDEPVDLAWRPGDDTLYLVERPGRVRAVRDGTLDPTPVLDVSDLTQNEGERGLLGLAFSTDGRFGYVNYTDLDGNTVIAGYPVGDDGRFNEGGRFVVYEITQPFPNHNGGAVLVGPDGLLYVPTGDGGSGGDPLRAALDLSSPLGKILRIKPEPAGGYTVPDDNPYVGVEGALPDIWSTGLRNPWRVSFDRTTGDLWVADVGQNAWEEISVAWADEGAGRGASFGWSAYEGTHRYHDDQPADGHLAPVFEYPHGDLGCSVSGGVRYRGAAVAGLQGHYVFGDFCSGRVWALPVGPDRTVGEPVEIGRVGNVVAVAEGPDKELWVLSLVGEVFPIVSAAR
jgi:glucose/arabinose dehydrogenase